MNNKKTRLRIQAHLPVPQAGCQIARKSLSHKPNLVKKHTYNRENE